MADRDDSSTTSEETYLPSDYTVAWICALPCELTAARAMLDVIHQDLPAKFADENIYSYGSIGDHNITIVCLPNGVYGTTSAAVVATRLLSTFPNIELSLMVGIGGGVPGSEHDIRLGDVVVSVPTSEGPAVVQYDFGKTVENGRLERKGHLNKPKERLLQAVGKLRTNHDLNSSTIPNIIAKVLQNKTLHGAGYGYPGSNEDVLFASGCEHVDELACCPYCGPCPVISRSPRPADNPQIHYGLIASGNQVMKNSRIRDQISKPYGLLCFEMEAAGLMDTLQCLVIRGICDYCDARKNKSFQKYASITAAAYAKELLSIIPSRVQLQQASQSLRFEQNGFRLLAIKPAHVDTCQWLLHHPTYCTWLDDAKLDSHHGLLWIKAKPGAGKSTIMKFALESMQESAVTISFFFNARGSELESSTIGLYRSLLVQLLENIELLEKRPELYESFKNMNPPTKSSLWSLELLQSTFVSTVRSAGCIPIFCFVDALDEGVEDDIREMLEVFTDLGALNATNKLNFRVCFASRHYPQISLPVGLEIKLDQVEGHMKDIALYIDAELPKTPLQEMAEIKMLMLSRSGGVFLWAVLVVRILKKQYDHGRVEEMRQKLLDLPNKLHKLFRGIVLRDDDNQAELLLCLQWLLYAFTPLNLVELFFAIRAGTRSSVISTWDRSSLALSDMARYIVSSSKGLVEVVGFNDAGDPRSWLYVDTIRVQFIHESVRDFLTDEAAMLDLWPGSQSLEKGSSHAALSLCCFRYFSLDTFLIQEHRFVASASIMASYPMARYVSKFSLSHAELACKHSRPQLDLLQSSILPVYLRLDVGPRFGLHQHWRISQTHRESEGSEFTLFDMLIKHDLFHLALLQAKYENRGSRSIDRYSLAQLLLVAIRVDESEFVKDILDHDVFPRILNHGARLLAIAGLFNSKNVLQLLVSRGIGTAGLIGNGKLTMHYTALYGQEIVTDLLSEAVADVGSLSIPAVPN